MHFQPGKVEHHFSREVSVAWFTPSWTPHSWFCHFRRTNGFGFILMGFNFSYWKRGKKA